MRNNSGKSTESVRGWVTEQAQRLAQCGGPAGGMPPGFVENAVVPSILSLSDDDALAQYVRTTFRAAPPADVEAFLGGVLERKHADQNGVFARRRQPKDGVVQMVVPKKQQFVAGAAVGSKKAKGKSKDKGRKGEGAGAARAGGAADPAAVPVGDVVFRPPREDEGFVQRVRSERFCGCLGTKHAPLTNCMNCGKVACEAEGYGPCTYCGTLVQPRKDKRAKARSAAAAAAGGGAAGKLTDAEKAMQLQRNLLEFDRTAAQRTVIYDDQEDYYSSSEWLSPEERQRQAEEAQRVMEEKQMKKEDERRAHLAFDFAGRTVSVVDGKTLAEAKRAAGVVPEQQAPGGKGLNRIVQDRGSKGGAAQRRAAHPKSNVPVAPGVDVPPVYARVQTKKGEAPVALSREDGSLDRFLEALRFQQIEEGYFQEEPKTQPETTQETSSETSETTTAATTTD